MQFGVAIWPFQWSPPYEEGVRRIAGLGFRNVELIAWIADALATYYTPARVADLRRLLADLDVGLSEFVFTPRGVASADAAQRAAGVEQFRRAVDVAQSLGAPLINSVVATPFDLPFPSMLSQPLAQEVTVELPSGLDWRRGYDGYVEALRACCVACEGAGLRYALETHPHRWATTAMGLLRLIEHVGSPALGVNMDPSHMSPCGDMPQVAAYELGDRVLHCHFSDNDGASNAHWRPGKGKIDWAATLVALRDVGFDGVISLEFEGVAGIATSRQPTAAPSVDREYALARRYLSDLAAERGVPLAP